MKTRNAIQRSLKLNRDLLFDFLSGMALPLGDHLRGGISDVWVGFDCKLRPAIPTEDRQSAEQGHDQPATGQA
jgi:hypothetical protein